MYSFPSALKSVLSGRSGPDDSGPQFLQKPWSLFWRATPPRSVRPAPRLSLVVENEVIPRLVRAKRTDLGTPPAAWDQPPSVTPPPELFVRQVLLEGTDGLLAHCRKLTDAGLDPEALYQELLAPTARLISEGWREDDISFVDATIGLGRLRSLVYALCWTMPYNGDNDAHARTALFAARPGEEQAFGSYLVEESFRWAGWRTFSDKPSTSHSLAESVRRNWCDVLCLSISRLENLAELRLTIDAIRRASCHAKLSVLVEGRPFIEQPGLVAAIGADAAALDGGALLHVADKAVWPPTNE
jgi:methanogenic corrinoid protein MtbC1